jgi:hypothetical protein
MRLGVVIADCAASFETNASEAEASYFRGKLQRKRWPISMIGSEGSAAVPPSKA